VTPRASIAFLSFAILAVRPDGALCDDGGRDSGDSIATVAGTVRDGETGAPLAGAFVSLTDIDRASVTEADGRYEVRDVAPGPQHVVVRRIGYASQTFHALVPRAGMLEIDVALRAEPITLQAIDVGADVAIRGLDDADSTEYPDRGLSIAAVRNHPLSTEPDVFRAASGGEVVMRPESPSGMHIRGGASDQVAYLVDGIPVFSPYHSSGTFSAWNPDALAHLDVLTTTAPPDFPDALSGAVSARTRSHGGEHRSQGSVSTTQARVTVDGPVPRTSSGYLVSWRWAFPGLLVNKNEPAHIDGESMDALGKLEARLLGGRAQLFGYLGENDIDAASAPESPEMPISPRHELQWDSRTVGGAWTRPFGSASLELRAWSAAGDAGAMWLAQDSLSERLEARRRDEGGVAMLTLGGSRARTTAGLRAQRIRTAYSLVPDSAGARAFDLDVRTPVVALFAQHARSITARVDIEATLVGASAAEDWHLSPSAKARWRVGRALTASASFAQRRQFAQSLRNPESIVANIFPVDLFVGAGDGGVPVARSNVGVLALEHRPTAGTRVGAQAYARDFDALALVAPLASDPFATTGFLRGSGDAQGVALEIAANSARYGILATYGYQDVRLTYADTSYVPDHGSMHSIEAGIIVFPSPTADIRLGIETVFGRRGTSSLGLVEWEACNLLDQGCEFAGSPGARTEPLGATRLPDYLRLDIGARKHWHVHVAGHDAQIAVFGTATNLLARKNVLALVVDPATGERQRIEMRPLSPLVVGIDWRF
jgi:hypothetical protein